MRKAGEIALKHFNKVAVIFVLFILTAQMSACDVKTSKSYTYRINTGNILIVSLDTSGGYDLKDDYGDFIVKDRENNTVLQGSFNSEDTYSQMYSIVKGNSDYSVLEETGESLTYVVYGKSGWETNRIIRLKEAKTTIVMGSLYEDSNAVLDIYDRLTFAVDDQVEQPGFFDREVMGISMKVVVIVAASILIAILAVIIFLLRRKSLEFEYYYSDDEMDDSIILRRTEEIDEEDRLTQDMFAYKDQEKKQTPQPHIEVVLRDKENKSVQYTVDLRGQKTIGRNSSKSDVVIPGDKAISREHCAMWVDKGDVYIRNISPTNGTKVNGDEISDEYRLVDGDVIGMGNHEYTVEVKKYDD